MQEVSVPPSPNWYLSQIIDCSHSGQVVYGSRENIVLYNNKKDSFSIAPFAHKGRISSVQFAPAAAGNKLVSSGEDCVVCVWDLDLIQAALAHIVHTSSQHTPIASWSHADPNLVVSADTGGYIVSWNLQTNLTRTFNFQVCFTTLSCSPHDKSIIALGTKTGLVYVMNISGKGRLIHKLRGHDFEIASLAWCPVRENIFNPKEEDTCLLASGARDSTIYLWRTASEGRYEKAINLPKADAGYRMQGGARQQVAGTIVCWPAPDKLVAATQFGEIYAYDMQVQCSEAGQPAGQPAGRETSSWRLLHRKHHSRGVFSIVCRPYSTEKSGDDSQIDQVLWTVAQDRQMISCTLDSGKILREVTTIGGPIYAMAISPIDGTRLAVGVADKSIRLWNLSDPNPDSMISLKNKVSGKVYSLAWHPKKEGCLAYGTSEGRIGLYDTMSTKPVVVFRQHFTQAVYVLEWGPNIDLRGAIGSGEVPDNQLEAKPEEGSPPAKKSDYLLYAVADSRVCVFDPDRPSETPINLKYILRGADAVGKIRMDRNRTGLSWKPDFSLLAVGNEDGSVHFLTAHEATGMRHVRTVSVHSKLIQDLAWHPISSADEYLPSHSNWLAVASNENEIRVVDVSNLLANVADAKVNSSELVVPVVAVLKGHHLRVVNLVWNPHVGGQLLSTSYDESAVIWDVASEKPLRHFTGHFGPVLCGLWSPLDPDLVVTGANDACLWVWRVSTQEEGPPPKKKRKSNYAFKQALPDKSFDTSDQIKVKSPPAPKGSPFEVAKSEESMKQDKKFKDRSLFPVTGLVMNEPTHLLKNLERLIESEGSVSAGEASEKGKDEEEEVGASGFFGDKEAVDQLLEREHSALMGIEHFEGAFTLDIWRSRIKEAVEEAIKNQRLTDYIVSLSPMASIKVWQTACMAYAEQLCRSSDYIRSASYYLSAHKVEDAVNMLMERGRFRQAVVIAKSRLAMDDPFVRGVMEKWAQQKLAEGQIEVAANCLASIGEWTEAANVLIRRKSVPHLCVAARLASRGGADEKAALIFLDCLKRSDDDNWDLVWSCLANLENQESLKLLVAVYQLLSKRLREKLDPERWLKGTSEIGDHSFELDFGGKISKFDGDGQVLISKRLEAPLLKLLGSGFSLSSRTEALLVVSINLALAIICAPKCFTDLPEVLYLEENQSETDVHEAVRRLVQAMAALSSYQLRDPDNGHLLLKLCILLSPKGPTHPGGIFSEEVSVTPAQKSARAYLCTGIVNWLTENGSSFIPPKVEVFADRKPALKARRQLGSKRGGKADQSAGKTDQSAETSGQQVVSSTNEGEETVDATIPPTEQTVDATIPPTEQTVDATSPPTEQTVDSTSPPTEQTVDATSPPTEQTADETAPSFGHSAELTTMLPHDTVDVTAQPAGSEAQQTVESTAEAILNIAQSTKEATETADQPTEPRNELADQHADSTRETMNQLVEPANQPAEYTANHTAESSIETVEQTAVSTDETCRSAEPPAPPADLAAKVADEVFVDYPKPAWVYALDLIKRYSHDLFSYSNMRYFSDNVRIKVLLHLEANATKEKLDSMNTTTEGAKSDKVDGAEVPKEAGAEVPNVDGAKHSCDSETEELTVRQLEIRQLQEWFSTFEKEQVVVPNPFVCYSNLHLVLKDTFSQVDKNQTEIYAEYFKNVWEEAKAKATT